MNTRVLLSGLAAVSFVVVAAATILPVSHSQTVDTTPSRQTIEDASKDNCQSVSAVVQRCSQVQKDAAAKDDLSKSLDKAKQGFDRENQRGTADALKGDPPSVNTPVGDAQQLGGVSVTGKSENKLSIEEVLQRALGPANGVSNGNGTVSHFAPNGTRYDCIEKCVGPACCAEVRAIPNPARQIGGPGAL
jgi:hypothetical protein